MVRLRQFNWHDWARVWCVLSLFRASADGRAGATELQGGSSNAVPLSFEDDFLPSQASGFIADGTQGRFRSSTFPPLPSSPLPTPPPSVHPGEEPKTFRPDKSAELVDREQLPLHTLGRYIVGKNHVRVKWACINWGGAYTSTSVVGGLHQQPLRNLSRRISELGFNCVRLPYSTEGYIENPVVTDENLAANPEFKGMRFRIIFDKVVEALTDEGLMVIINNHISSSGWCCNNMQDDGYWYTSKYDESLWIMSLTELARRYRHNSLVVAFDIRNEPHDNPQGIVTWGDGNPKTDWAAAAERAGNKVLEVSPDVLIVVSAICFCTTLRDLMHHQVKLMYPNRIVYEVHNYFEFQAAGFLTTYFGVSWVYMQHVFIVIAVILLLLLWFARRIWCCLGAPLPPHGILRMTFGFWIAAANLIVAPFYAISFRMANCTSYAWNYYTQLSNMHVLLAVAFGVLGGWGYLVYSTRDTDESVLAECLVDVDEALGIRRDDDFELPTLGSDGGAAHRRSDRELAAMSVDEVGSESSTRTQPPIGSSTRRRPQRVLSGYEATDLAWQFVAAGGSRRKAVAIGHKSVRWDRGLCCGLQFVTVALILLVGAVVCAFGASLADSYTYLQWVYDWKWGFALTEGYPYTAPIWMGEFGQDARGRYWKHLMRYLSVRDLDFAYWCLDGVKLADGRFDVFGQWQPYKSSVWEEETYGLLNADFHTVRHPWKLLDLQSIMPSPAGWTADDYPCDRAVLGNACGG